jgi:hypothetical protein
LEVVGNVAGTSSVTTTVSVMTLGQWHVPQPKNTFFPFLINIYLQVLRKERTSTKCLNVPKDGAKDKRSEAYKENDTSGGGTPASEMDRRGRKPRKKRQKPMIMRILGPLVPRGNVV